MRAVTVRPVSSRGDLKTWVRFPRLDVYSRDSPWVPPLDRDLVRMLNRRKNPFFRYGEALPLLAADENGKPLGRVLAHIYHRHNVQYGERASFFGYFECVEDRDVAGALIEAAKDFGRKRACTILRGPFNMTAMQEMGILVDGFDRTPTVDETYTAPYYLELLESAGLARTFPVTTFRIDRLAEVNPDSVLTERHRALLAEKSLRIRSGEPKNYKQEFETLRELLNDSFYDNPYFVPITRDEFEFQIGPYRRLMDPHISLVAEIDGVPCAFVTTVPDFNPLLKQMNGSMGVFALIKFLRGRSKIKHAVLIIMGVQRQLQGLGVMRIVQAELIRALQKRDYQSLTITWIADVNDKSLGTAKALGAKPLHRLTLYEGRIEP